MHTLTPEEKAKAEERKAKRAQLMHEAKIAEQTNTQEVTGYVSIEGHNYSGRNQMFLALQNCPFGKMGGFHQWKAKGFKVKKGEHGHDILIPCMGKKPEGAETEDVDDVRFYKWTVLFHESQVEKI